MFYLFDEVPVNYTIYSHIVKVKTKLTENKVIGSENFSKRRRAKRVHRAWLQVDKNRPWYISTFYPEKMKDSKLNTALFRLLQHASQYEFDLTTIRELNKKFLIAELPFTTHQHPQQNKHQFSPTGNYSSLCSVLLRLFHVQSKWFPKAATRADI